MTSGTRRRPQFEIDASVVYELGEKLISDEVQAVVELAKNAYDADASYANVVVEAEKAVGEHSRSFPDSIGYVIIEDDGMGMDWRDIRRGWLTISASPKRPFKARGAITPKGRTPLGDKGLGRLSSQRLGQQIEIWTVKEGSSTEYYVGLDWASFQGRVLSKVPVYFEQRELTTPRKGTKVVISGLRSPEKWEGKAQGELVRQLSQLLFPFDQFRPCDIFLTINGARVDLDRIPASTLEVADARYVLSFDGDSLRIEGYYRLAFLLGQSPHAKEQHQRFLEMDRGKEFYAFLMQKSLRSMQWREPHGGTGSFAAFAEDLAIADQAEVALAGPSTPGGRPRDETQGTIANPGPFRGEIFSFTRKGTDLSAIADVFSLQDEFSKYVDRHSGIRVFRDGFGVRPFGVDGNDWLQLGRGWTSGTSYYGLRPKNVIGYVALTARDNSKMEEATDREGFVENAYSRNFLLLMRLAVRRINHANAVLRRWYNEYTRSKSQQAAGLTADNAAEIFTRMRDASHTSVEIESQLSQTRGGLEMAQTQIGAYTREVEAAPIFHDDRERAITPLLQEVNRLLTVSTSIFKQVEATLLKVRHLGEMADVLELDLEHLQKELEMFSQLAGLGITAEALSHEISIIADGLAARTRDVLVKIRNAKPLDPEMVSFAEHVYSAIGRIRKQLSHLDPSMRYLGEQRDKIRMRGYFRDIGKFYEERLARSGIQIVIDDKFEDFTILMNRGKLTQVVDNLLLNSEYWLREDLRKGYIHSAQVIVRAVTPTVDIYDTGRGVSPSLEQHLFQPFVTAKPQGRGLGLFISRQLLESSGCSVDLLPERNCFGRQYIFHTDFAGAVVDE